MFQQAAGGPRKIMQAKDPFTIATERDDPSAAEQVEGTDTDSPAPSEGLPLRLPLLLWVAVVLIAAVAEHGEGLLSFGFWFSAQGMSVVALDCPYRCLRPARQQTDHLFPSRW